MKPEDLPRLQSLYESGVLQSHDSEAETSEFNDMISLWNGDITILELDAIVNAANKTLMGGGGVDGAIHRKAGPELKRECATLKGCQTGEAKITKGYNLPSKHVIHTVGPIGENPEMLKKCYISCLDLLVSKNLRTIAFPCISTGVYGYPIDEAAKVSLQIVKNWLETNSNSSKVDLIVFCTFLQESYDSYIQHIPDYFE